MIQIFKEITIGGLSKEKLISQLVEAGVQFNKYANTLFEHPSFSPGKHTSIVKLVKVTLSGLSLQSPCSYRDILTKASHLGLQPGPLHLGAFLRLQYLDQPEGPYLTIATPHLENVDENFPTGFYLRNLENKLWLRGYHVNGEPDWPLENEFIFMI